MLSYLPYLINCAFWLFIDLQGVIFTNFLKQLDLIFQKLYSKKYNVVICSDVNVNYLTDNNRRSQLDAILHSYNLVGIVEFPTR
jgi:hypothetical protein